MKLYQLQLRLSEWNQPRVGNERTVAVDQLIDIPDIVAGRANVLEAQVTKFLKQWPEQLTRLITEGNR